MANPIVTSCPECKKQMKAPAELGGKKVRCKGCGHAFTLPAPAAAPKPAVIEADDSPYGVKKDDLDVPRCPHCAKELESDEVVICVNCGYNMKTRQRVGSKKVIETTPGEHFQWLLPGIGCVVGIVVLIGFDLWFCLPNWSLGFRKYHDAYGDWDWLDTNGVRLWVVIGTLAVMFFLAKFAFDRLILHPNPPEREIEL